MQCIAESAPTDTAVFFSPEKLVTATPDGIIIVWRIENPASSVMITESAKMIHQTILRGHSGRISCLRASPAWSILVSTSIDGTALVWDMNRTRFLYRLTAHPEEPVRSAAIDDGTVCIPVNSLLI